MLLPDKYLPLEDSFLGLGAQVLSALKKPTDIVQLWKKFEKDNAFNSFNRFIITLGVLYRGGLIELNDQNQIQKTHD